MLKFASLQEGQRLQPLVKNPVTKEQLVQYAHASGDLNPLHTDDDFAKKVGMPGVIAHGMLIMGFLGQYVGELAGEEAQVSDFQMRFGAITRPDDTITCYGIVKHVYEKKNKRLVELDLFAEKAPAKVVGSGTVILTFH